MKIHLIKVITICSLLGLFTTFYMLGINDLFTVETLKAIRSDVTSYKNNFPLFSGLVFILVYISGTSLSLPVAGILSISAGAIFGLFWGTILASIAGTTGAIIAFLLSRYLFRDYIQNRYGERLTVINEGVNQNGHVYLLTMRLVPVIPYFIINSVMGVTPISVYSFCLVSFFGMIPITIIMVNGGVQIASINTIQDIMSVRVIISFLLIGLIPIISNKISKHLNYN